MEKEYRYKGYTFRVTDNVCLNDNRRLYEIDNMKPAAMRPFLTSINECREFISDAVEMGYWLDGNANYHYLKK